MYKHYYDIGVAVSTPSGLVVPVVRNADQLSFAEVEKAINELGARARDGRLAMEELVGGTFTISNGGVYGSLMSAILNPPQVGILGMHKIQERPVAIDGEIKVRPMMYLALSYDHRIVDGREAVSFLVRSRNVSRTPSVCSWTSDGTSRARARRRPRALRITERRMNDQLFDVVVIGGGPGGYVAAIRAAQLGMKVACVERRTSLGTCLNIGCIPSKALLHSSELFADARDGLNAHGIRIPTVELDLPAMQDQKAKVVKELTQGIEFLFRKNKVTSIKGAARLEGPGRVAVELNAGGGQLLNARNIIIATGSRRPPCRASRSTSGASCRRPARLELENVPAHLVVVGAGYIGLELGTVAAARRQGHRGRVARSDHAGHGPGCRGSSSACCRARASGSSWARR